MSLGLYMDENVLGPITQALRQRGVDLVTVQEDGLRGADDPTIMDRATELRRVLVTHDDDLLAEAARRQAGGVTCTGVVYAHQLRVPIGQCVHDLELIAKLCEPEEMANRVQHLPL